MTKLEEKLIELGYVKEKGLTRCWTKEIGNANIDIWFEQDHSTLSKKYCGVQIKGLNNITKQTDLDNLQQAYNQLQKDLEVLKDE